MVKCACSVLTAHLEPQTAKLGAKERKEKKRKEKEKKRKENQIKAETYIAPWADLPGQLGNERNYYRHDGFSSYYNSEPGGITKVWRAESRGCSSAQKSPYSLHLLHQQINNTKLRRSNHVNPNSSPEEQFISTNSIRGFDEKWYKLNLQGTLGVFDFKGLKEFEAAKVSIPKGVKRAIPSTCCKGFREYLVRSGGNVLLILLVSRRSMSVVDDVEVYRLDLDRREGWIKIESLGDLTMFLGSKCCMCFPANEFYLEFRKNCIYFTHRPGAEWWVFDVGTRSISPAIGV